QVGCKPYINGNLGSGTVREMSEWVEYMTLDGVSPMADLRKKNGREEPWKVDYFGVGNESWGCGGNMLPEYYADEYRRYQTYVRNYDANQPIYKIACGPNGDDYDWTDTVMKRCFHKCGPSHGFMDGFSLHYYTVPGPWEHKGSATDFDLKEYYVTLKKTLFMEELIQRHTAIMDKYDKDHEVGLVVDEWGTWYDVEPGTNPGFLYQQNTIRDALVAGINLNIFNKHCDRVKMANIAQLVNVLQSVILTEGDAMIKTPTYHVFHMYQHHQDADLVESHVDTELVGVEEENQVVNLTESVSVDADGILTVTLTNLSADQSYDIDGVLVDANVASVEAKIVTGAMNAYNSFDKPNQVEAKAFDGVTIQDGRLAFTIPASSVMLLRVTLADGNK
ncbi:MAG: alpha-N-arabinofuranosidase, partial [Lachnospiraceae bacterium]|nr:alpha-N-arabinofuranosidase [Lachnospiraceae bacterium]